MSSSGPLRADISFRRIHSWHEYVEAEELQRRVWQMPDWRDAVPANLMITVQKNGGLVIGAFDPDGRLVGLVFGFMGAEQDQGRTRIKHCSHMLAVLPEYQSRNIGVQLKLEQRRAVLAQGLELITWTFDPLLALNAHLNLARLGGIARCYIPDAYGEMTDGLNAGLASDRFQVEWWLNAPRVQARVQAAPPRTEWEFLAQSGARRVFEVSFDARGLPHIAGENALGGDSLFVEIPADLAGMKALSLDLAREWRARTRDLFTRAFTVGYVAVDFVAATREGRRRAAYLLTRQAADSGIASL